MPICETCGNAHDKAFQISMKDGNTHWIDSFECAIHALALTCKHCGCRIAGHGVEESGVMFCCAGCAQSEGVRGTRDRAA